MCGDVEMHVYIGGGQRTTWGQFSPSTLRVLVTEHSSLALNTFTHRATLQSQNLLFVFSYYGLILFILMLLVKCEFTFFK